MKKVCWLSAGVSSFIAGVLAQNVDEYILLSVRLWQRALKSRCPVNRDRMSNVEILGVGLRLT